jgi:hypothetical protein
METFWLSDASSNDSKNGGMTEVRRYHRPGFNALL